MALFGGGSPGRPVLPSVIFGIPPAHSRLIGYVVPVISVLSALALTVATTSAQRAPVSFFMLAVLLSTLYGGRKSGWIAAVLAILTATCLLIPLDTPLNWNNGLRIIALALVAASVVATVGKLQDRAEQLLRLNRTLRAGKNSSRALLHATTEQALLRQVCRIVTEELRSRHGVDRPCRRR